jgi:hypothetical protein
MYKISTNAIVVPHFYTESTTGSILDSEDMTDTLLFAYKKGIFVFFLILLQLKSKVLVLPCTII